LKADFTQRNTAIDILRALTMFVMIFVNDFWTVHDIPHWMEHAGRGEDFLGLADTVFPCFLFVVGMSVPYAFERRYARGMSAESTVGHILSRTLALLLMGVFIVNSETRLSPGVAYSLPVYRLLMVAAFICIWNQYPQTENVNRKRCYLLLKGIGILILLYLAVTFRDGKEGVFQVRWWGILGLIGWSYLLCALIYVFTRDRLKYLIPVWIALVLICIFGSEMNEVSGREALLPLPHPNFYSEMLGILHIGNGALPAFTLGGVILSILSARYIHLPARKKVMGGVAIAGVLLVAGILSHRFWIVSKLSETPTWLFYITTLTVVLYTIIHILVEKGKAHWFNIIKPIGTATLTAYIIPYVVYSLRSFTGILLPDWFMHGAFSIVNCLCFAFVITGLTKLLGYIHIKLKI
jgi:predicted acyltransferase